jgi:hypothetical protein
VLYNKQKATADVAARYQQEGAYLTRVDTPALKEAHYAAVAGEFLGKIAVSKKSDILPVTRSLIRHDAPAVARAIIELYRNDREG